MRTIALYALIAASACARGSVTGGGELDAMISAMADSAVGDAPAGSTSDAGVDGPSGNGLDPALALPGAAGRVCDRPGAVGGAECPFNQVCRFFSPADGRCEGCTSCLDEGAACTASSQCDIMFDCYRGRCTSFCTLGSNECGAATKCLAIGHATFGVCEP